MLDQSRFFQTVVNVQQVWEDLHVYNPCDLRLKGHSAH